ncbi:126aa long hypothetical protein [Pyrococcus horikoshii OT3]|uniref:Uncharacterized protein n=1 Tax=Pyrococcus horikoshii (strain ATCC 700860 / DSM 12428 / JCM 9974 / NBRC 100139 / OT-3) TaxID=70601 RepID=O59434_PYRHO|nr:126aa long hypothetical protein [Pyrococcus horikoshii OT3]
MLGDLGLPLSLSLILLSIPLGLLHLGSFLNLGYLHHSCLRNLGFFLLSLALTFKSLLNSLSFIYLTSESYWLSGFLNYVNSILEYSSIPFCDPSGLLYICSGLTGSFFINPLNYYFLTLDLHGDPR